jgi:2-polyprenyl-3-methyl-5-hydroxy-6-metoxy-1,4-benzoquinol methylase
MSETKEQYVDYRSHIYERYASNFQDAKEEFDNNAAERWGRAYRYYYRNWLPQDKSSQIVDLACGGGFTLYFFKSLGFDNVQGVDISPEQVALSRQVTADVHEANILDFLWSHKGEFDVITGLDIIEHFHKPEVLEFIDRCHAALKSGGRLILQTPNADSMWGTVHRYNDFTHEVGFNPNALGRLLKLYGYENVEAREQGPVPSIYNVKSGIRYMVWQSIRLGLKIWNLAETGNTGGGVFTRNLLISGIKK